jgi:hypothetical protein
MITSFVIISKNGYRRTPGTFPSDIPKIDFFKPEYQRSHYLWEFNNVIYSRKCDPVETRSIELSPNSKYLIVTQSPEKYGPDNLLILYPDGTENRRLINPYRFYSEYQEGDEFEFLSPQAAGDKLMVKISVCRTLPGKPYKQEPTYGTFYDCDTWEHTPLEFIDSRNL